MIDQRLGYSAFTSVKAFGSVNSVLQKNVTYTTLNPTRTIDSIEISKILVTSS